MNQRTYSCIIVDDEPWARQVIETYICQIPYLKILASCRNAIEAQSILNVSMPDILFLDIEMPALRGTEFLQLLPKKPATIFTTAYAEYGVTAFNLDAIDYLMKPFEFDRFFKAVQKCIHYIGDENPTADITQTAQEQKYLFVKSDYKLVKINFDDIIMIEALQKYIRIHTHNERIITLSSMKAIEDKLPQSVFIRIHRSAIVNKSKIHSISGNLITIDKFKLVISKSYKESVLKSIQPQ